MFFLKIIPALRSGAEYCLQFVSCLVLLLKFAPAYPDLKNQK